MSLSKVPVLAVLFSFLGGIVTEGEKPASVGMESKMMIESTSWYSECCKGCVFEVS